MQEAISPTALEGTLAYISPEQTGRMNRLIDYRSDYYSLGVTFYQMLTGRLPFESTDPLELIHCHIARTPNPPRKVKKDIPEIISQVVLKLMAKDAEQRYQSIDGLLADLETCLEQWSAKGAIEAFPLCREDLPGRLNIQQKLYGREVQVAQLLEEFKRVSEGAKYISIVSGYSGIGKTSLVKEVHKPIVEKHGYFISGKFEQFKRTTPYLAFSQAFRSQIQQLLGENEEQLAAWKDVLLKALGPNGKIVVDIIPELEQVIGKQPDVPELDPVGAQHRFQITFQNFVRCFATADHPLTVFLDDMQWADGGSMRLMEVIFNDHRLDYFFLIGAYRDNEVDSNHPLIISLKGLKSAGTTVNTHILGPLSKSSINDMLMDSLNLNKEAVEPLVDLIFDKTSGNPFFINAFLETLYRDNYIYFDDMKKQWQWKLVEIKNFPLTDNVVDLMVNKLKHIPEDSQEVLKLAACIGNQFDLVTLATVNKQSEELTEKAMLPALEEGLVYPFEESFVRADEEGATTHKVVYKFSHDRVQQAAYTLIEESQRKKVHLTVGHLLLDSIPEKNHNERIFDIVNQLNAGIDLIKSRKEKTELARLNLVASKKSKASVAYAPSLGYIKSGVQLLAKDSWEKEYNGVYNFRPIGADGMAEVSTILFLQR